MPTTRTKSIGKKVAPDEAAAKLAAAIAKADFDDLSGPICRNLAALMDASAVRVYLRDTLSDELYCPLPEDKDTRELRVPIDPSSVAGYAAMTRHQAFAWMGDPPQRNYVVALPLLSPGDLLGVVEMINAVPNAVVDEARLRTLESLARAITRRLQTLLRITIRSSPYDYLLETNLLTPEALRDARERAALEGKSVEAMLLASGIDKTDLGRSLAEHFERPFVPNPAPPLSADPLRGFSADFLRSNAVLPVALKGKTLDVVVSNPRNLTLLDDLRRRFGDAHLSLSVAVREDILAALDQVLGPPAVESAPAQAPVPEPATAPAPLPEGTWELAERADEIGEAVQIDSETVRLVNGVIQTAIDAAASDIHFETLENGGLIIRFRIDGICHDHLIIQNPIARSVVSRLKIMSQLDIAEHRLPQDGKIRMRDPVGRKIDLRVAVMPTTYGFEDVVMRILPQTEALPLADLGMEPENLERFRKAIEQPHGIVLCVGPTGSGKTTTLHAALGHLKNPEVKIWAAEDPIEITQERVRQVQIHPKIGFTFERALRAFLRLDPDIIMIGEIRDRETADAAIEASLTGHLVLSTLHTNSAPETITRLLEMGLDPFAFGDSLRAVLAQRLVRRLCASCRETVAAGDEERDVLRRHYGDPAAFDAWSAGRAERTLARAAGCDACYKTGYKGRAGIHELLVVTPEIRGLIQKRSEASAIRQAARARGLTLLKQDGIRKVLQGVTDLHEVLATCIEETD
ncbi:MAG: Flp pilus assembly complex ATPase component TadA [Planctomycetes bacterium]|nr:Flp pilus assembly complex ATPase component TadA [Planctomycetota bacterium]